MHSPTHRALGALGALGGLLAAFAAPAAAAPRSTSAALALQQGAQATDSAKAVRDSSLTRELERVVIVGARAARAGYTASHSLSALRTDTPLRDTPQSVTVLTQQVIADQAMLGMADVVRYVPGISMGQGEGHRDAPTIRGQSSTADFFVDGVRVDAQYYRDVYNVERIEALKGANAMAFGRGGGGGVLNRVTKMAEWTPTRQLTLSGGAYDHKRAMLDVGQGLGGRVAARLNGMFERSGGFRDAARLERSGVNPTATFLLGGATALRVAYEHVRDERNVDRGMPSWRGSPAGVGIATFFGNPGLNASTNRVHAAQAAFEHRTDRGLTIRNRTHVADYDKFYQNTFPSGTVDSSGTQVSLAAYSNATQRRNVFNQTDLTAAIATGALRHTLLLGAEVGRQRTRNFRETGFFDDSLTSVRVSIAAPTVATPVSFRQSATDADNAATTRVAAVYAQDQVAIGSHVQLIGGVRYERFDIAFDNHRNDQRLEREDAMVSPRAGVVVKPVEPLSIYGSYGVSLLPISGDQFSSLTVTTQTLEPERFTNREVGVKWDVLPGLALSGAAYAVERTNTAAPDPLDPTRTVQTGSQRTRGVELGAAGRLTSRWQVAAGYAAQRATITSTTTAAREGADVALVPRHAFSVWNRYQVLGALGVGLGLVRQSEMFAAVDNSVTLPGFTRVDGALFAKLGAHLRAQVNVENVLDRDYYPTSHGNNNIMPGAPRTLRLSVTTEF